MTALDSDTLHEEVLDKDPICQAATGCSRAAVTRCIPVTTCCQIPSLLCQQHAAIQKRFFKYALMHNIGIGCATHGGRLIKVIWRPL